ncbi:hypothetical protein Desdi_2669 [Desulfitobacterium dichloroeliminans LMG P-21439]|uniref:Uncharacterized protein n=1 Tax=Desulfitobacterium dichloroeliminans (strain LMG P-21439 / DCA1) TaxID=871963 RepID=L0F8F1_DESDL|nr:hypothetical protein [Desulfitobacterium dichloroeliminans]AGA70084.1 hypothetical protein Desdi_2669 [Desulfitobacterium dichloroeliminans LMG P-21439]
MMFGKKLNFKKIIETALLVALMFPVFFLKYIGTLNISVEAKTIIRKIYATLQHPKKNRRHN